MGQREVWQTYCLVALCPCEGKDHVPSSMSSLEVRVAVAQVKAANTLSARDETLPDDIDKAGGCCAVHVAKVKEEAKSREILLV